MKFTKAKEVTRYRKSKGAFSKFVIAASVCFASALASSQTSSPIQWLISPIYSPNSVACSSNGVWTAVGGDGGAAIYQNSNGAAKVLPANGLVQTYSVAFSPNSKILAVSGIDTNNHGVLQLWDVTSASLIGTLNAPSLLGQAIAFSPDGSTLAVGGETQSYAGFLQLWNVESRKLAKTLKTNLTAISTIQFSKDGSTLADAGAFGNGCNIELWTVKSGILQTTLVSSAIYGLPSISLSPDGKTLAAGGQNKTNGVIELWSASTGKLKNTVPTNASNYVNSVAFSPDGTTLADCGKGSSGGVLELWNVSSNSLIANLPTQSSQECDAVAFFSNGKTLADVGLTVNSQNQAISSPLEYWNVSTHRLENRTYTAATNFLSSVAYSPKGGLIANGATTLLNGETVNVVQVRNATTNRQVSSLLTAANNQVKSVVFSQDGSKLVVSGSSISSGNKQAGVLEIWDPVAGKLLSHLASGTNDSVNAVAFSSDDKTIACAETTNSQNGMLVLYDASTGAVIKSITLPNDAGPQQVAYSPDGKTIAVGGQQLIDNEWAGMAEIWNVANDAMLQSFATTSGAVQSLCFSPDGTTLATGSSTYVQFQGPVSVVETWNVATGTQAASLGGGAQGAIPTMAFSPDGQYLISELGNLLEAFSMANGAEQQLFTGTLGSATSIAFNPTGSHIAIGMNGGGLVVANSPFYGLVSLGDVSVDKSTVSGGMTVTGTVTIDRPAPAVGAYVVLSSNNSSVTVPASLTILAGHKSATFTFSTKSVTSKTIVGISAVVGTQAKSVNLTIN